MHIVILDDDPDLREMLKLRLEAEFSDIVIFAYESPREFLFRSHKGIRLVVSDFQFEKCTLEFYWPSMMNYDVLIWSGSVKAIEFNQHRFINKSNIEKLIQQIRARYASPLIA